MATCVAWSESVDLLLGTQIQVNKPKLAKGLVLVNSYDDFRMFTY